MIEWVRQNWHVLLGAVLAFGVVGLVGTVICSPCWLSLVGLSAFSEFAAETPYAFLSPTPTPAPTQTPTPLAVGEFVTWGEGIRIGITEYSPDDACGTGWGEPAEGAKFIGIRVYAENVNQEVPLSVPSLYFTLLRDGNEIATGQTGTCTYEDAWAWQGERLFPNVSSEGWEVFEVPQALNTEEALVRAESRDFGTVYWRLGR
jgi:hypothetical protein